MEGFKCEIKSKMTQYLYILWRLELKEEGLKELGLKEGLKQDVDIKCVEILKEAEGFRQSEEKMNKKKNNMVDEAKPLH